jgi:hypothetical protein
MTHPLFNENPFGIRTFMFLHPGGIKKRVLRDTFEEGYDENGKRINARTPTRESSPPSSVFRLVARASWESSAASRRPLRAILNGPAPLQASQKPQQTPAVKVDRELLKKQGWSDADIDWWIRTQTNITK